MVTALGASWHGRVALRGRLPSQHPMKGFEVTLKTTCQPLRSRNRSIADIVGGAISPFSIDDNLSRWRVKMVRREPLPLAMSSVERGRRNITNFDISYANSHSAAEHKYQDLKMRRGRTRELLHHATMTKEASPRTVEVGGHCGW